MLFHWPIGTFQPGTWQLHLTVLGILVLFCQALILVILWFCSWMWAWMNSGLGMEGGVGIWRTQRHWIKALPFRKGNFKSKACHRKSLSHTKFILFEHIGKQEHWFRWVPNLTLIQHDEKLINYRLEYQLTSTHHNGDPYIQNNQIRIWPYFGNNNLS